MPLFHLHYEEILDYGVPANYKAAARAGSWIAWIISGTRLKKKAKKDRMNFAEQVFKKY